MDNKIDGVPADPEDATRADWPTTPNTAPVPDAPPAAEPPAAMQPIQPPAMPAAAPPPAPAPPAPGATAPWGPPGAVGGGAWAPPPVGGGKFAVPGAPGLEFAGALPRFAAYFVDGIIVGILNIIVGIIVGIVLVAISPRIGGASIAGAAVGVLVDAVYFIGFWTTASRATLGMRLLNLQVGNAFDGLRLDRAQAFRRWVALGSWLGVAGFTTALAGITGLIALVWWLILLITTINSPTKQGLHDRFANSAVVRPAGSGDGGALACVVIVAIVIGLILVSFIALIFLGSQISTILSEAGQSI